MWVMSLGRRLGSDEGGGEESYEEDGEEERAGRKPD